MTEVSVGTLDRWVVPVDGKGRISHLPTPFNPAETWILYPTYMCGKARVPHLRPAPDYVPCCRLCTKVIEE